MTASQSLSLHVKTISFLEQLFVDEPVLACSAQMFRISGKTANRSRRTADESQSGTFLSFYKKIGSRCTCQKTCTPPNIKFHIVLRKHAGLISVVSGTHTNANTHTHTHKMFNYSNIIDQDQRDVKPCNIRVKYLHISVQIIFSAALVTSCVHESLKL